MGKKGNKNKKASHKNKTNSFEDSDGWVPYPLYFISFILFFYLSYEMNHVLIFNIKIILAIIFCVFIGSVIIVVITRNKYKDTIGSEKILKISVFNILLVFGIYVFTNRIFANDKTENLKLPITGTGHGKTNYHVNVEVPNSKGSATLSFDEEDIYKIERSKCVTVVAKRGFWGLYIIYDQILED